MFKACVRTLVLMASALAPVSAIAAGPQLICFGNEPSWSLQFSERGRAHLLLELEQKPLDYRGRETRLDFLKERAWRGKPASGKGGELVAFLRESACSDGMSDITHPVTARVSLPDSRLLAGCCRIPPNASASVPLAFEGPTWQLAATNAQGTDVAAKEMRPLTARFEGGRVSGFSGCNRFMGSYTLDRDNVLIGPLAGTMMACPEPQMAIEKAFLGALSGTLRYAISGAQLTLSPATGASLVFQVEPAPTLQGVTWSVTGFNNGRQAVVGPILGTTLTVTFDQGRVFGSSGCNTYHASYTSESNRLAIGPVASTRKACSAEGVMQQEREFLAALETVKLWAISGGMLDIHRADGERVLNAVKAAR